MNKVFLFNLLIWMVLSVQAQETLVVSIDDLKEDLLKNNLDLNLSTQNIELHKKDLDLATKSKLPTVQFFWCILFDECFLCMLLEHAYNNPESSLKISKTSRLNSPAHIENFQAIATVVQPILNLDAKHYRNASRFSVEANKQKHRRSEEQMVFQLEEAFLDLQFLYRLNATLIQILERTDRILSIAQNALEEGYAYPDDLLKAELRKKEVEDQILETELQIKSLSVNINYLCGRDLNTVLQPMGSLDTITIISESNSTLNPNRADLLALQHQIQASKERTRAIENSRKPRINAFLSYEANLHDLLEGGNGYLAGIQFSWQLFDASKTAINIQKAKINQIQAALALQKDQKKGITTLNHLNNQNQIIRAKISTAKSAIIQAEETLRISLNRYQEGLEKTEDLIVKEINLSQRIIALQQLYLEHQKKLKAIAFTAG